MEKSLFSCVMLLAMLSGMSAYAQEVPSKRLGETMFSLSYEDIEVSAASNVLKDYAIQPVSISIIEKQQLRLSGARSLVEALTMLVPGFFAVEDQDDVIAGFRGLAPDNNSKVLLLINGQNMNTEYFWGPPDAILNSIALDYIERIEVIRGPGSVTLGQGALLGVINIITHNPEKWLGEHKQWQASAKAAAGSFGLWDAQAQAAYRSGNFQTMWQTQFSLFEGERMRNEGWIKEQNNQGAAGGKVYDMNHHLRRGNYQNVTGLIGLGNFKLQLGYFNSIRDLYNFYRDRDRLGNRIYSTQASYLHPFSDRTRLNVSLTYIQDHLYLESSMFNNAPMGGVREDRYGAKAILNVDQWIPQNDLAVGVEYRYFDMGKPNFRGHNFIANVHGSFSLNTANDNLTMVYPSGFAMYSALVENVYSPSPATYIVAGLRLDRHPFWGINLSPRIGWIQQYGTKFKSRLSYQMGFRGSVGLSYTGGYRNDGFLRAENYDKVEQTTIPNAQNIDEIQPERLHNMELSLSYAPNEHWNFEWITFSNIVQNVIDVGVIYEDPANYQMVPIGSDIPGDWNGYWYFKNTPGSFVQIGGEWLVQFKSDKWKINVSHALVKVLSATEEQKQLAENSASMYLATDNEGKLHYKAYPENVSRLSLQWNPIEKLQLVLTNLYYFTWYSPIGTAAEGSLISNLGLNFEAGKNLSFYVIGKNLLNQQPLYPMNSNAGGPDVSPGTPAWESISFWGGVKVTLP